MVPFSGAAPVFQNLLGGHVALAAEAGFGSFVDDGKLRVLGLFSDTRLPRRPQWPALREQGYDVTAESSWGIGGPAGMDKAIVERLHAAFEKAAQQPDFVRLLERQDQSVTRMSSADYAAFAARQFADEGRYVKEFNLKLE